LIEIENWHDLIGLWKTASLDTGGTRGRLQGVHTPLPTPPRDKAFFFVYAFKICLPHQSVTPFLSGAPLL